MGWLAELVATFCAGLFAGGALYISGVEHPARLSLASGVSLPQFRRGFLRARGLQASLALLGAASAGAAWASGGGRGWLVVAALLIAIVAFTLGVVTPVYGALLDPELRADAPETRGLLTRWGRLHIVRTGLGAAAFATALASLLR